MLISSKYSTVICAPIYTSYDALSTQIQVGIEEGLKHDSSIHCDELVRLHKSQLTHYIGSVPSSKMQHLNEALAIATGIAESC